MLADARIGFVGSGAMAEAMIEGLLKKNIAQAHNISAAGPREERARALEERFKIGGTTDNVQAVTGAQLVVLSVKPQVLPLVLPGLRGRIASDALVLSIVAGARIDTMITGLAHASVVRSMPNSPAQPGHLSRRHNRRGAVLSGKSRLSSHDLARRLGRVFAQRCAGAGAVSGSAARA